MATKKKPEPKLGADLAKLPFRLHEARPQDILWTEDGRLMIGGREIAEMPTVLWSTKLTKPGLGLRFKDGHDLWEIHALGHRLEELLALAAPLPIHAELLALTGTAPQGAAEAESETEEGDVRPTFLDRMRLLAEAVDTANLVEKLEAPDCAEPMGSEAKPIPDNGTIEACDSIVAHFRGEAWAIASEFEGDDTQNRVKRLFKAKHVLSAEGLLRPDGEDAQKGAVTHEIGTLTVKGRLHESLDGIGFWRVETIDGQHFLMIAEDDVEEVPLKAAAEEAGISIDLADTCVAGRLLKVLESAVEGEAANCPACPEATRTAVKSIRRELQSAVAEVMSFED